MMGLSTFVGFILCATAAVSAQERVIRCPNLMSPQGGRLVGECSEPRVGDECYLECDKGHRVNGVTRVRCVSDGSQTTGRWENQLGRCERLTCSILQPPMNGQLSGQCTQTQVGGVCVVSCSTGYNIQGSNSLTCTETGQWSGSIPLCTRQINQMNANGQSGIGTNVMCPDINAPINGMVSGQCAQSRQGDVCKFTCATGFRLQGLPSLVCNPDGSWSGAVPSCY